MARSLITFFRRSLKSGLEKCQAIRSPDRPIIISLEVFNKGYYAQDPLQVAKTGLAKMKSVTQGV